MLSRATKTTFWAVLALGVFAYSASAASLTSAGSARLSDADRDGLSETLRFATSSHFLSTVDPASDPLSPYASQADPSWCYMPRNQVSFHDLTLVEPAGKCYACTDDSFPLQQDEYKGGLVLSLLVGQPHLTQTAYLLNDGDARLFVADLDSVNAQPALLGQIMDSSFKALVDLDTLVVVNGAFYGLSNGSSSQTRSALYRINVNAAQNQIIMASKVGQMKHGSSVVRDLSCLAASPDGRVAAFSNQTHTLYWVNLSNASLTPVMQIDRAIHACSFGDADTLFAFDKQATPAALLSVSIQNGQVQTVAELPYGNACQSLSYHPDGFLLAGLNSTVSGYPALAKLDPENGNVLATVEAAAGLVDVQGLSFDPSDGCVCENCRYEPVLTMDVLIRQNSLDTSCDDASFSFCYTNAQVDNSIDSPILQAFADADPETVSCGYGTLDGVEDLASQIKSGRSITVAHELTINPPSSTSGCSDCGLESNGRMASQLAKRYFLRGQSAVCSDPSGEGVLCDRPYDIRPAALSNSKGLPELASLTPDFAALGLKAVPSTPDDLPSITNALDVLAYDHFDANGVINGALLMLLTENAVYEHTKAICDRASGRTLEQVSWITERGMTFPIAVLRNEETGGREIAVSFSSVASYEGLKVYARWGLGEYPTAEGFFVYNIQLWSGSLNETRRLLGAQLDRLEEVFPVVIYDQTQTKVTDAFFTHGYKFGNRLEADLNTNDLSGLQLKGRYWPEETPDQPQIFTIPAMGSNPSTTLQNALDVELSLVDEDGRVLDSLYLSDGSFTAFDDSAFSGASETEIKINESCQRDGEASVMATPLTGCARLDGKIDRYGTIVRTLGGREAPMDMTHYNTLSFRYAANQVVVMCLESKRRAGQTQACTYLPPQPTMRDMQVTVSEFNLLGDDTSTPRLDDIVAISWNLWNPTPDSGLKEAHLEVESLTAYETSINVTKSEKVNNWVHSGCNQTDATGSPAAVIALILAAMVLVRWRMWRLSRAMHREDIRLQPWQRADRR
jgi:hypothetical protein